MTLSITTNPNLRSPRTASSVRAALLRVPPECRGSTGRRGYESRLPLRPPFAAGGAAMKNPNLKKPNAQFGAPTPQGFL
jgi:hypothetical protein